MTVSRDNPGLERALDELGWLRALAADLCADPQTADDAVQATMMAALQHRPDLERPVRGWLATVLVNVLRTTRRAGLRRRAREDAAARRDAVPSPSALAERVELQQMLLQAVHDLQEPVRSTVVLRYLEEQPPRVIAARQNVPVATVKARLRRGLTELRQRLDARHGGDRRSWMALLAGPQTLVGTILMSKQAILATAAVLLALAVWWIPAPREQSPPAGTPVAATIVAEPIDRTSGTAAANERLPVVSAAETGEPVRDSLASTKAPPPSAIVRGIVVDLRGSPRSGMTVLGPNGKLRAVTDGQGRFEVPSHGYNGMIRTDAPGWATVLAGSGQPGVRDSVVVAAPEVLVRGHVVSTDGQAIAGAKVTFVLPRGLRGALPFVLDDSEAVEHSAQSDAEGTFELASLPAVDGSVVRVAHGDFAEATVPLPIGGDANLRIVLGPPTPMARALQGVVVDPTGRRVADALVVLGRHFAKTDGDGAFILATGENGSPAPTTAREILAVAKGSLPARVQATGVDAGGGLLWPQPLVLELGGPALSIAGTVRNADGTPAKAARVWVHELVYLGDRGATAGQSRGSCFLENELRGSGSDWQPVRTDDEGRFEIGGLCAHDYHVTAMLDRSVQRVDVERVAAGRQDLDLRFDAAAVLDRVRGYVTDRAGVALANIRVRVTTDTFEQRQDGRSTGFWSASGSTATTDADGRFVVRDMPMRRAYLRFDGDDVLACALGRGEDAWPHAPAADVHVVMMRRSHFRVELYDGAAADQLEVLDAAGENVPLTEFEGRGSSRTRQRCPLVDGRSSSFAAPEAGQTLVLYLRGVEVRRSPLTLVPGQLTVLRL